MSLAVLQKAAGDLHLCHGNIGKVKFFGGEPLLEYDLLRQGYSFLKENGFAGTFEVGTNGILLEDDIISWLSERPDIQVNLNAWFDNAAIMLGRKGYKSLQNVIWNLCIYPKNPNLAFERMKKIHSILGGEGHRINLLPAAYCLWNPRQLMELDNAIRTIFVYIGDNGLVLENVTRNGNTPLFNDGPAVDTDGTIYVSNVCLADMPASVRKGLVFNPDRNRDLSNRDLINIYGFDKIAATYAASRIMSKYVGEFQEYQYYAA